ncbi:E3 SUMO-protein ligase PIAS3-like [Ixodes scapularis]|uniref:E3 SUMO-protein ligase PIAS3-like n=1 Tax=Ixodes scapularis TaxID=6945 RepID=UPI001A9FA963|nr:E3 SUMO-protein ligase PIAS3-like [Ixodes scapularis]
MLPPQPFYAPVYKVRCSQVGSSGRHYSCRLLPKHLHANHERRRVLLVFNDFPEPECKHDEMTVTLKINDAKFYGVPLKMLHITGHVSATVNDIRIKSCSVPDGLCDGYLTVHVVNKTPEHELVRWCGDDHLKGMDNVASTHDLVKKAVGDENTEDIVVDFITLALTCPLSRTRIKVPCRGPRCSHVQAFDAMAYLEMNESTLRPLWRCPVCDQSIKVEELRIDLFALDLLGRIDSSCGAVKLFPGGRWTPVVKPVDVILIGDSPIKPPDVDRNLDLSVIDLTSDTSSNEDD